MNKWIRSIILIVLMVIFSKNGDGNNFKDTLYFQAITMKDGLPGSIIMDFEQDSLGFIWIATNDGLCRYDGTNFLIFKHNPNNNNSLWNNNVQNLFIDKKEKLWIMTSNGLNVFDLKQKTIHRIGVGSEQNGILDYSPSDIVESKDGTLFIGSYYSGISYSDSLQQTFNYLNDTLESPAALSSTNINCLHLFNDSLLFIGYRDAGVDVFNRKTNTTKSVSANSSNGFCSDNIKTICQNANKGLWIGTDSGLSYYDIVEGTTRNFPYQPNIVDFIVDREILSLHLDNKGYLWIGTRRNGLVIVSQEDLLKSGNKVDFLHYVPNGEPGSLSYRTILKLFNDKNNQVWIGTHGGGINFIESKNKRFGHVYHMKGKANSLSYNKVWGITQDYNGNIWIGTDGDGVNVWNEQQGVVKRYKHSADDANSLSDNAIISALTDSKGRIWIGTYEGGINRYNDKTDNFTHYNTLQKIPVNDVRCIYEDENGNIYAGLNRGGVAVYNEQTDEFNQLLNTENYDVRSIFYKNDALWLGTYSFALIKYNLKSKSVDTFEQLVKNDSLPNIQSVYSVYGNKSNDIWFGTDNLGLCVYNSETGQLNVFTEHEGLVNNKVHAILPDDYGNLWLSTNNGISRFDIKNKVFYNYDWHKGVQSQEFHNGSQLITNSGNLCFGGIDGMNYFNPKHFQDSRVKPNLKFTGFTVMNRPINPGKEGVINKSIEYQPKVNLNYRHSIFTIAYQSLNYPFNRDASYEYKLDGYDEQWVKVGQQNIANYKNVSAGDYLFKVKSYHTSDKALFDQISLSISIAPPWWKTIWAYLIYTVLAGIIAFTVFRYRVKQYEFKNKLAYERKLREKQEKLHEERLEFFTNISHELRTPLTIISVALEELVSVKSLQPRLKKTYETAIKNSDRLKDLINKLLEFRRVEKGMASLSVSNIQLNKYLQGFLQDFRQLARNSKLNLKLSLPLDELELWIDQDKFSMILNNLLSNAIKNTKEGGQIVLSADEDTEFIYVKVKDTGTGIEKTHLKKIFNRYYKVENKSTDTGIGLALTKKLVELHFGTIEVESVVDKGTRFILKFKKGNEHYATNQLLIAPEEDETVSDQDYWLSNQEEILSDSQKILLLIDDNKEILDLLHDKFVNDYKIIKALSGEEGILSARKFSPDLIISDIMMPGISGIEVCQLLKNDTTTSHIPIILLTAKGSEKDEIEGLNTGADDYISKPFKFTILKARVNTILENREKIVDYFADKKNSKKENEKNELPDKELAFLNKLNEYILNKCLSENISVFDMASDLGFSRTSLYRKVKSLTGLSINAFVRSVKISKSAEYISEGMNVSEAAYSVGFEDLKYFRESFKKQIGKKPSEFK